MMSTSPRDPWRFLPRWSQGEWVVAVASVVMAVALLLDWTSVSCAGGALCALQPPAASAGLHGWAWLSFGGLAATVCLLVVRGLLGDADGLPRLTVSDRSLYTALGGVELLGCFLFWVDNPSVTVGPVSIGPGPGWYLGLLAAAATMAGGQLVRRARTVEQLRLFEDEGTAADLQSGGLGTTPR